jgi:hypothetical protein
MEKAINKCTKCGLPVTDSVEVQIEQHEKIKLGRNTGGIWICDDCKKNQKILEDNRQRPIKENNDDNEGNVIGMLNMSDVSPNTPTADET